ncbi:hypothetical protein V8F33_004358 [Rhypophila sp. PSN 637]
MLPVLLLASFGAAASISGNIHQTGNDPSRYTICGADRGYTERDSLLAAEYLTTKVIRSEDHHPLRTNECVYAHVNTTIVSLCNGNARNRTVNRAEVRRGIDQLIKDCGLEGGFTGIHVVNNLTFSAFGVTGAVRRPTSALTTATKKLKGRECRPAYDGVEHTDCDWKNRIDPADGKCHGEFVQSNDCQVFCELKRTGLYGRESRPDGKGGDRISPGFTTELTETQEYTVSHAFSVSLDGVAWEAVGAGLGYQVSFSETKGHGVSKATDETSDKYFSRWVFFPKLIESCGTVSRMPANVPGNCMGDTCAPESGPECDGEISTVGENVCSLAPLIGSDGNPEVDWALRYETDDGTPAPFGEQPKSYQHICKTDKGDPDGDRDPECFLPLENSGGGKRLL